MNNFNIDLAIKCVKTIVDNCRCVNCDHLNESRSRYTNCGHSICEECVLINNSCLLCSPISNPNIAIDKPQTERLQHVSELLNTFQDLFNTDVYRKQRISEKLKVEKEIFPACIQAPIKYYNKRKSCIFTEKENIRHSLLPGESILTYEDNKMEKSKNYVQQWLNRNESNFQNKKMSRKPLTDLSINTYNSVNMGNDHKSKIKNIKRSFSKSGLTDTYDIKSRAKIVRMDRNQKNKSENDESGIELNDESCIILDSQSEIMDKDRLALMMVLEADKNCQSSYMDADLNLNKDIRNNVEPKSISTSQYKTPFYKKSKILEICEMCAKYTEENTTKKNMFHTKDVTVTIDSKSFLTTIKFSEIKPNNNVVAHKTVAIQTEFTSDAILKNEALSNNNIVDVSKNCFKNKEQGLRHSYLSKTKCVVIEDSDTDSLDNDYDKEVEVQADVHRSSKFIDYAFKPLESQEYENRVIPKIRGNTPASSNSSDKENYDPNKRKQSKSKGGKKKNKKLK